MIKNKKKVNQDIFRLEDAILVEYGRMETGITGQETIFYKLESFYIFKIFSFVDSEFPLCKGFPGGSDGEESTYNAGDVGLIHGWGKITWRREWLPTPVCLPGEPHGQRSLVGCGLRGRKDSDTTKMQQHTIIRIIHREKQGFLFGMQECGNLLKCIWIAHTLTE